MFKIDYKDLAAKLFCWGVIGICLFLFAYYFLGYLIPFIIAWLIAYALYPLACELSAKVKIPRKICSALLTGLLLVIIMSLIVLITNQAIIEIQNLFEYLSENGEVIAGYFQKIIEFFTTIEEKIPIINQITDTALAEDIKEKINEILTHVWNTVLEKLGSAVPNFAAEIVVKLPEALLVTLIAVIACFYLAADIDTIHKKIKEYIPKGIVEKISQLKTRVLSGFKQYLKAYCILFLITFAELFVGFLVLGIDYSFILAILIAIIDFLPVLGAGAVILPWGIILVLMKNYFAGIGMLILFLFITVIRQIIEPKILGKSFGVHPLVSLLSLYLGFRLFGIAGMILLPMIAMLLLSNGKSANDNKK